MDLIIVESPHKAEQIQRFLGTEKYKVVSSKGHIRDLEEKGMSIDIADNFSPRYVISPDKKALVADLRKKAAAADMVWLASDPDREGEAIAWHIAQTLELPAEKIRRITYNEVTPAAVKEAIANPRDIDMDLVNAQQARRVLDRLVGFELSPVLWRKVQRGLSAGRVQSATLRLVVDREREIAAFRTSSSYQVEAQFTAAQKKVKGTLDSKFGSIDQARQFLQDSIGARFTVESVEKKEGVRNPSAPFTTSTMQQEAARKLRYSSSRTMSIAQRLYEQGLITYMRTDSTNLSSLALGTAKNFITETFGAEYSHPRNYKTRSKGAQEAHEAIRPTFIDRTEIEGSAEDKALYNLIWKRTVASQMTEASLAYTTIKVAQDKRSELFSMQSAQVIFDGFLKLYSEGTDDSAAEDLPTLLPDLKVGDELKCSGMSAICKFTQPPYRYSEQTLIKKMEEIGIGRPSTYSATISTLTKGRGYIVATDKSGTPMEVTNLSLKGDVISEVQKTELVGAEKRKFVPSEIGLIVTDYLMEDFSNILDYDFTAKVEDSFDDIAEGSRQWTDMIADFYTPFHGKVDQALSDRQFRKVERVLGVDPADGKTLTAKFGPYGAYVQKGEPAEKLYANLQSGQLIESITLEEAIKLFALPRVVGQYQGVDVIATKGKFGPYLKYGNKNVSLPRTADPLGISLEDCVALIQQNENKDAKTATIAEFPDSDILVINGNYGPYIKHAGSNYKIPRGTDAAALTEQDCLEIIASSQPTSRKGRFSKTRKK